MRIGSRCRRSVIAACVVVAAAVAAAQQGGSERDGRAWLGLLIRDPDREPGPVVTAVDAGGPAATAGLTAGDIVLRVDGAAVADRAAFIERLRDRRPGDSVRISARDKSGVERTVTVLLAAERGFDPERLVERLQDGLSGGFWPGRPRLGVDVADIDADLARYFTAPRADCVLVTRVHAQGPAERAGLHAGDLVLALEGADVHGVEGLQTLLGRHADGDSVRIEVWRRDRRLSTRVQLDPGAAWRRRPARSEPPLAATDVDDLQREVRRLRQEVEQLRREVDILRRQRGGR
jgi:S1-C subfamily serine protease